jgi:hypothetical protein
LAEEHELPRIPYRQRAQEDLVDEGKNRGIRADAEREGQDSDGGEAGGFSELSQREANVREHG